MRRCSLVLLIAGTLAACAKPGGSYAQGDRPAGELDRGETQGRMFDFVSNKPEGDDWQIRLRGSSLWASYSTGDSSDELGTRNLSKKEASKVWELIDALELVDRKKGRKDEDEGYVYLRLREPGGDEGYDFFEAYVSRATEDEAVIELAEYVRDLITKYHKEKPNF